MIDLTHLPPWPTELRPAGAESRYEIEPFPDWWRRVESDLSNLDPSIAEQWIHRHFDYTDYRLPLGRLSWRKESWPTQKILAEVFNDDRHVNAEYDYDVLRKAPTGKVMLEGGTWDYPMLTLHTPKGVKVWEAEFPNVRFKLIEGHLRFRFLNAMASRREGNQNHNIFILELV